MGRKPKAAKLEAVTQMPESLSVPSKMERTEPEVHKTSASLSVRKKASKVKTKTMIVRRSGRLQNLVQPARDQEMETVIELINLVESEREDEPLVEENTTQQIPGGKSLEEKLDQLIEGVEELKSKVSNRDFSSEGPSHDLNYKSLYIHSQKKIESLTNEIGQLSKQLQIAHVKIEAYENVKKVMDKLKDVILVSNLTKATEAVVNLSSQVMFTGFCFPSAAAEPTHAVVPESPAKKKRRGKGSK